MIKYNFFNNKKIIVTGGAGFIGGCLIRRILRETNANIFNIDKLGYASDLSYLNSLENHIDKNLKRRHSLINIDLYDLEETKKAIETVKPDIIFHFAAESHVDRSIQNPDDFIKSNIIGTYNLLVASKDYYYSSSLDKKNNFILHHISTDEVFGSLQETGYFNEETAYDPRSPYSASKASSDHLVSSWHHTYKLPIIITNCSNNYGPWQFPEKLIPLTILKAIKGESIPLYGDGKNIRDWLYVEDHIDAILTCLSQGEIGESYCIGGNEERNNKEVMEIICKHLDQLIPEKRPHSDLIKFVQDRPGHDRRYAINSTRIKNELNWEPHHSFEEGMRKTINWYLENISWCEKVIRSNL